MCAQHSNTCSACSDSDQLGARGPLCCHVIINLAEVMRTATLCSVYSR